MALLILREKEKYNIPDDDDTIDGEEKTKKYSDSSSDINKIKTKQNISQHSYFNCIIFILIILLSD